MKVHPPLLWPCVFALVLANASFAAHDLRQIAQPSPRPSDPVVQPPAAPPTASGPTNSGPTSNTNIETNTATPTLPLATTSQVPTSNTVTTAPLTTTTTPTTTAGLTTPTQAPILTTSIDPAGDPTTITITSSSETSSSTAAPTNTSTSSDDDGGGGLSTGSIIGMSVAAGVAVIGIVAFFIWKLTRKRFADFDDNEAIKWPELNHSHSGDPDSHALPARETVRPGFDTGSEADLSRVNSTSNYSTPDFGSGGPDPYAVPPLPHLNPNQPYRDDPATSAAYYDPYRGPVPGTLEHGPGDWQPEAYPMTQFGGPPNRGSPAPEYRYEGGRQSPATGPMYGGGSPAPQVSYGGRASPGPQLAYGGGRASPGPHAAYSAGRASPGPHTAYETYGAR